MTLKKPYDLFKEALFNQIEIAVKDRATETKWEEEYVVAYDSNEGILYVMDAGSLAAKSSVDMYYRFGRSGVELGAFVLDERGYRRYVARANLDGSIPEPNKYAHSSEDQAGWKSSPKEAIDAIVTYLTDFWREPEPEYCETCPCNKAPDKKK